VFAEIASFPLCERKGDVRLVFGENGKKNDGASFVVLHSYISNGHKRSPVGFARKKLGGELLNDIPHFFFSFSHFIFLPK
jgi:hypothetical protein